MHAKDLVQIIRDNPGCRAVIDNDAWWLYPAGTEDADTDPLVTSSELIGALGDGGYGSGHCYGGDILQALAVIVGIEVESV